jgi:lycopene cyclase domain-containing protein
MVSYFLILFLILIFPIFGSIYRWRYGWNKQEWLRLLKVYLFVSVPFVVMDSIVHQRGWWSYNSDYIVDIFILGLPIEEVLFFFVIPFASLYLYSIFSKTTEKLQLDRYEYIGKLILLTIVLIGLALVIIQPLERTIFDVILAYMVLILWIYNKPNFMQSFWIIVMTFIFVVTNYFLTSLPIVTYDEMFGSSIRLISIPAEDFFYNISLLLASLVVFLDNHKSSNKNISVSNH